MASPKRSTEERDRDRSRDGDDERVSLYPLDFEEALRGPLQTKPKQGRNGDDGGDEGGNDCDGA